MAGTFKFELVSPERVLMSADAEQVVVPGASGDFTVLVNHAPVLSILRPGVVEVTTGGTAKKVFVRAGFAEVEPDRLTILAQKAYDLSELDAGKIAVELASAEAELAASKDDAATFMAQELVSQLKRLQAKAA